MRRAPVEISLDVGGVELTSTGRISRDSAAVESGQTGRLVYASIETPIGLKPGDFVTVKVQEPPVDGVIRLPAQAYGSDGAVLVLDDSDRLESLSVELVRRQGDEVLVRAEALDGRRVVAERTPLLGAGIGVRPISDEDQSEGADAQATDQPQRQGGQGDGRADGGFGGDGEMISITEEQRQELIEAVQSNGRMPVDAKERILEMLKQPEVPKALVDRMNNRRGG